MFSFLYNDIAIFYILKIYLMKNLKFLSFALLFWVLIIAWCEKANNQEKVSCEGDEVCPVEETVETPSLEIEEAPTVIINGNPGEKNLWWNLEWDSESYEWWQEDAALLDDNNQVNFESVDVEIEEPTMDLTVDENVTTE